MTKSYIPTINVSSLIKNNFETQSAFKTIKEIEKACVNVGFFQVIGHGLNLNKIKKICDVGNKFFNLPDNKKIKLAPKKWNKKNKNLYRGYFPNDVNGKEGLDIGDLKVTKSYSSKLKNQYIDIVFNPEFLTEANAVDDFENQTRLLLGGPLRATTKVKQIFSSVFRKTPRIIKTDAKTAELVKYVTNAFLSTKVSFANEMYQLCEGLDLDYDKIIEYATLDPRLGDSHWGVPGPDGDFGFGGHCFPKDLAALIEITKNLNTVNNVLKAVQTTNNTVRSNRDWEKMKGRAIV